MNVQNRTSKGQGIISDILQILDSVYFGEFHFQAFLMMRQSLFLSVLIHNLEVSNLSKKEVKTLESLDYQLMRRALGINSKQSIVLMQLELGVMSVKYHLMKNRLMYMFHLLSSPMESLSKSIFLEQIKSPLKQDWATLVKNDMKYLNIKLSFEQIQSWSKNKFKEMVSEVCQEKCFNELL